MNKNYFALPLYLIIVFTLFLFTQASLHLIIIGTLPLLIFFLVIHNMHLIDDSKQLLVGISVALPLLFLGIWLANVPLLKNMEMPLLLSLQFLLMLFVIGAMTLVSNFHKWRKPSQTITKKTLFTNIKSLIDKSKEINYAIGRVYSDKHGGSEEVRDFLHIPREEYHLLEKYYTGKKIDDDLLLIIKAIHLEAAKLVKTEKDLFGGRKVSVINFLQEKDKKYLKRYQKDIVEICVKIERYLEN